MPFDIERVRGKCSVERSGFIDQIPIQETAMASVPTENEFKDMSELVTLRCILAPLDFRLFLRGIVARFLGNSFLILSPHFHSNWISDTGNAFESGSERTATCCIPGVAVDTFRQHLV
jgi:hypothetical protein